MQLTSSAFEQGSKIPSIYTCDGKNINPPLTIKDVPKGAKSLVLIMEDSEVPEFVQNDRTWVHWVVFNIPPATQEIKENSKVPGTQGKNTKGELGYQGPCPPFKEHHYFFKLYALDAMLSLREGAKKEDVAKAMQGHVLAEAELMDAFKKSKK